MQNTLVKYNSGGEIKKAILKVPCGDYNIVINERAKVEFVKEVDVVEIIKPNTKSFYSWLQKNYKYNKLTDEWVKDGKRYTESSLQINYFLTNN